MGMFFETGEDEGHRKKEAVSSASGSDNDVGFLDRAKQRLENSMTMQREDFNKTFMKAVKNHIGM
jgi:hypothetical protein